MKQRRRELTLRIVVLKLKLQERMPKNLVLPPRTRGYLLKLRERKLKVIARPNPPKPLKQPTTQQTELARFAPFLAPDEIARSNALFGYQGDVYYYDIDIRRHFGLDTYSSDTIPYWKTETIEAMDAFRHKPGHAVGAGECVSLAGLYAAAAFVVCGLPLDAIYLMATPLHSQNFLDVDTGILTNNRRLVTKAMWANGTVISRQARRALEHERVTIVSHATGYIHLLYPEATVWRMPCTVRRVPDGSIDLR